MVIILNKNDGSCEYVYGCTDSCSEFSTQEDNSCIYLGCMNEMANNYSYS